MWEGALSFFHVEVYPFLHVQGPVVFGHVMLCRAVPCYNIPYYMLVL